MARKELTPTITKQPALYLRVSTDEQSNDGYGLVEQNDLTRRLSYAFQGDCEPLVYTDAGYSGTLPADKRPGMTQMFADIEAGKISTVIVASLDRIARKASLLLTLWDTLESKGVVIQTYKERIDTSTPTGRLMRTMLAAIAEFERDTIVERTTAGRNQRGKVDGDKGGQVHYGYRRDSGVVSVVPETADVVKHIFELRGQGLVLRAIADKLNAENVASPKGKTWSGRGVKVVLDHEQDYRGGNRGASDVRWPVILT